MHSRTHALICSFVRSFVHSFINYASVLGTLPDQHKWASAIIVDCNAGAGAVSAIWPGTGTVLGYNLADLAITFMLVNPLVDTYFGGLPPPAAMDAGARTGGPPLFQHADEQALLGDAHTHLHLSQIEFRAGARITAQSVEFEEASSANAACCALLEMLCPFSS